jgi:hypothetical protein
MIAVTKEFQFMYQPDSRVLVVKANGGTVTVECAAGSGCVVSDTYTADGAFEQFVGSAKFRIIPTGGAEYDI